MNQILPAARKEKKGVGAFNVTNYETAVAVISAAESEGRPVIIQTYQRLLGEPRITALAAALRRIAEDSTVPVALHLDHGASLDQIKQAIDLGYSSVMMDGSPLPLEENIAITREAVGMAHRAGLSIEGEIGHVPNHDKDPIPHADPKEAIRFAKETGVDALAVAVGTAHGFYKGVPVITIEVAEEVGRAISIPMVLHGGSDTPQDKIRAAIRCGMAKVNVATEIQFCYEQALRRELNALDGTFRPIDLLMRPVIEETRLFVAAIIRRFAQASTEPL
jgi:ketose-bisphosphate aldolase